MLRKTSAVWTFLCVFEDVQRQKSRRWAYTTTLPTNMDAHRIAWALFVGLIVTTSTCYAVLQQGHMFPAGIQIGDITQTCNTSSKGLMALDSVYGSIQHCDGTRWRRVLLSADGGGNVSESALDELRIENERLREAMTRISAPYCNFHGEVDVATSNLSCRCFDNDVFGHYEGANCDSCASGWRWNIANLSSYDPNIRLLLLNQIGRCTEDIDECSESLLTCLPIATCVNTPGSAHCDCPSGYDGDGESSCTDIEAPVLSFLGDSVMTIEAGDEWNDPGYEVTDNDVNGIGGVTVSSNSSLVSTSLSETSFLISYTATDATGNESPPIFRILYVVDTTPPVIYAMSGEAVKFLDLESGDVEELQLETLVVVEDNAENPLSPIEVSTDLDRSRRGVYVANYTVSDSAGLQATTTVEIVLGVFHGSESRPARSCLEVYTDRAFYYPNAAVPDGVYYIVNGDSAPVPMYCLHSGIRDAPSTGSGWTLLTSQHHHSFFSSKTDAMLRDSSNPSPENNLYSSLSMWNVLTGENVQSAGMEYIYEEVNGEYSSPTQHYWAMSRQTGGIFSDTGSTPHTAPGFQNLASSPVPPTSGFFGGYGLSRTPSCLVDGNVHNWLMCVAQVIPHAPAETCGIVGGNWEDGREFCANERIAFWTREETAALGSSQRPVSSCNELLESGVTRADLYWVEVAPGEVEQVYCSFSSLSLIPDLNATEAANSIFEGAWTLVMAQNDVESTEPVSPSLFTSGSEVSNSDDVFGAYVSAPRYGGVHLIDDTILSNSSGISEVLLCVVERNSSTSETLRWAIIHQNVTLSVPFSSATEVATTVVTASATFNSSIVSRVWLDSYGNNSECALRLNGMGEEGLCLGRVSGGGEMEEGTQVYVYARAYSSIGTHPFNPGQSCLHILETSGDDANLPDGEYYISAGGSVVTVYCKMQPFAYASEAGTGWTLLSSQEENSYFSNGNCLNYDGGNPSPESNLYSALYLADYIAPLGTDNEVNLFYEDMIGSYASPSSRDYAWSRQKSSILVDEAPGSSPYYARDHQVVSYTSPIPYFGGYGASRTGQCCVDGYIHNWNQCAAQTSFYGSTCGLVTMNNGDGYCPSTRFAFWIREEVRPGTYGTMSTSPGNSCKDIYTHYGGASAGLADGVYYVGDGSGGAMKVWCKMTPFAGTGDTEGGWTLLSAQHEGSMFASGECFSHDTSDPRPDNTKYSILNKADLFQGFGSGSSEHFYQDITADNYYSDDVRRWKWTRQTTSILTDIGGNPYNPVGFQLIGSSHGHAYLSGYGISRTTSCCLDGNIHNWEHCVAQKVYYGNDCGLVTGVYSGQFCASSRVAFWMRET